MFEIRGWGYWLYVGTLVTAFLCGYYWRIDEERRRAMRGFGDRILRRAQFWRAPDAPIEAVACGNCTYCVAMALPCDERCKHPRLRSVHPKVNK